MRKVTYDAPVGSVDLAAFDDDGEPYAIWPCHECLPWHVEVIWQEHKDRVVIREWHAVDCPHFQSLISDDA
jgi:hypothetical protein